MSTRSYGKGCSTQEQEGAFIAQYSSFRKTFVTRESQALEGFHEIETHVDAKLRLFFETRNSYVIANHLCGS